MYFMTLGARPYQNMAMNLVKLTEVGEKVGYKGLDLKKFVEDEIKREKKEQQRIEREDRAQAVSRDRK